MPASLYIVGTFIGSFGGGLETKYFGRKITMQTANLVTLCGFIVTRFGYNIVLLYIGRFLIGYANGLFQQSAPLYTGEINQPTFRKFTGTFFALSFTAGFALFYTIGAFCYWRDALTYVCIWPAINFLLLFACPKSPTWLMNKGRKVEAVSTIRNLRNNEKVAKFEIDRMEKNMEEQLTGCAENNDTSYLRDQLNIVLRGTFLRPFLVLTFILSITIQWCGTPAIGLYLVDVLKGFKVPMDSYLAAALITTYRLIICIIGAILASFVPRRPFYLFCNFLAASGTLLLGTCGYLQNNSGFVDLQQEYFLLKWLPMIAVLIFYTGISAGMVPIGFILFGELLPSNAREIGTTMVSTSINISFFISTKFVPHLREAMELHGLFYFYSVVSCVSILFSYLCIPETFGKSLEEIEDHYRMLCYGNRIKISVTDPDNFKQVIDKSDFILMTRNQDCRLVNPSHNRLMNKYTDRRVSTASIISMS